jgi:uncharacterized membrane protein
MAFVSFVHYFQMISIMEIEKGKNILIREEHFAVIQKRLTIKTNEALFTLQEARSFSKKLIQRWTK